MTDDGRWSAAIITHWIDGHDVFYAEWHNAPHAADLDLTTRFAIAVILNGGTAHTGDAYFIYDNFSDPDLSVARGFTIGIEDKLGYRGFTYAYAPCCNDPFPVQGYPPPTGTTLKITPVIFGENYQHTMSYEVVVNGQVPQVIPNTVQLSSDSNDPAIRFMWDTHYLYVRLMVYIPMIISDSQ